MISFPADPPEDTSFEDYKPVVLTFCSRCGQSRPSGHSSVILDHEGKRIRDPWTREGRVWHFPLPALVVHSWIAEGRDAESLAWYLSHP